MCAINVGGGVPWQCCGWCECVVGSSLGARMQTMGHAGIRSSRPIQLRDQIYLGKFSSQETIASARVVTLQIRWSYLPSASIVQAYPPTLYCILAFIRPHPPLKRTAAAVVCKISRRWHFQTRIMSKTTKLTVKVHRALIRVVLPYKPGGMCHSNHYHCDKV
jgi:hypothetical protein